MARILIVDDEESVRVALARWLTGARHELHQAADGNEALQVLAKQEIDVVVTDIFMPHREGLETIREIRARWPDVHIIAMSGGGRIRSAEFVQVAEKLGASVILNKPFTGDELADAVSTVLDRSLWQGE